MERSRLPKSISTVVKKHPVSLKNAYNIEKTALFCCKTIQEKHSIFLAAPVGDSL